MGNVPATHGRSGGGPGGGPGGGESKEIDSGDVVFTNEEQPDRWLQLRLEDLFERDWGESLPSGSGSFLLRERVMVTEKSQDSVGSVSEIQAEMVRAGVGGCGQTGDLSSSKSAHGQHPRSLHSLCLAELPAVAVAGCTSSLLSRALSRQCRLSDTFLRDSKSSCWVLSCGGLGA